MPWIDVNWTQHNVAHLAEHGVSTEDAEQVLREPEAVRFSRTSGRLIAFGYAADGRKLAVVYEQIDSITVYPVTAFEV